MSKFCRQCTQQLQQDDEESGEAIGGLQTSCGGAKVFDISHLHSPVHYILVGHHLGILCTLVCSGFTTFRGKQKFVVHLQIMESDDVPLAKPKNQN